MMSDDVVVELEMSDVITCPRGITDCPFCRSGLLQVVYSPMESGRVIVWKDKARKSGANENNVVDPLPDPQDRFVDDDKFGDIRVHFGDLSSYRIAFKNGWEILVLIEKDGKTHKAMIFRQGRRQLFIDHLSEYFAFRRSLSDQDLFLALDPKVNEVDETLSRLGVLDSFPDNASLWDFVNKVKTDPYSATLTAFSKLTDKLLQSSPSEPDEDITSLVQQSLLVNHFVGESLSCNQDTDEDFEVILAKPKITDNLNVKERSAPVNHDQWQSYQNEDGSFANVSELLEKIFLGGLEPSLRSEAWKLLLGMYSWSDTRVDREEKREQLVKDYFRMKLQWKSMSEEQEGNFSAFRERKTQIQKDIARTDRTHNYYQGDDNCNIDVLYDVLMTYTMLDFDLGYVQGMSDMLSPILYVIRNEVDAFWCFVGLMRHQNLRKNFEFDKGGITKQLLNLQELLKVVDPELFSYFISKDCESFLFCFRWLIIWFKREFDFDDIMKLWECLWTGYPCKNFHMVVAASMLHQEKSDIMENKFGFAEILKHINDKSQTFNVDCILQLAEAIHEKLKASDYVDEKIKTLLT